MALDIICIIGSGRSGTTLYDRILGTLEGAVSLNEVYRLWQEGFVENSNCACGVLFDQCSFWQEATAGIVEEAGGLAEVLKLHHGVNHSRHFASLYAGVLSAQRRDTLQKYTEILRKLYLSIANVSGASVIIDSSKVPSHALLLSQISEFNVHVVHAVRDVRALAYAWEKKKFNPASGANLSQYKPSRTIAHWIARNILCEVLGRRVPYQRLRYEDFVKNPQKEMQSLVDNISSTAGKVIPFTDKDTIELGALHTIGGNPHRFSAGTTQIKVDEDWREGLGSGPRLLANVMAAPLLVRYGYSVMH